MKKIPVVFLFFSLFACKRYQDPAPFSDPRLVNKYCNIPSAINYNWNFPGVADNSLCVYPAQIYAGNYMYHDSIFNNAGLFIVEDSFVLTFTQLDSTRMNITGFCPGNTIKATASRFFKFTIDTLVGNGQLLCKPTDTISGKGFKLNLDDTLHVRLSYEVGTDSGIVIHAGTGFKQ